MNEPTEIWAPIPDYEHLYEASTHGRIRRASAAHYFPKGYVLKQTKTKAGYLSLCLVNKGKVRSFRVNRVIAAAFLGPAPEYAHVNHRNGVKTDNRLANLEYVTPSQNQQHAYDMGRLTSAFKPGSQHPNAKLDEDKVRTIRQSSAIPASVLARQFGVSVATVRNVRRGANWSHVKV